ncbi:MAG: FAD-dependent 5-carboxymethylaminomethyl-2-thiouridine(34) oxidoreductase MnmC [Ideonella sp.]|nr:FAD-dependent 5-carboxymethylaminomethyl-2-thiouridine(34) oxidoreductase MnmC [Ideonella sp.]
MPVLGPGAWTGLPCYVVLNTQWDDGAHFVATWAAWQTDAQRPQRLVYVAVVDTVSRSAWHTALANCTRPDLAAQLVAACPPACPDLHVLHFEGGAVALHLAVGSASQWLPQLQLQADALILPQPEEATHSRLFSACARLSAPGAVALTSNTSAARQGLQTAGYIIGQTTAGLLHAQRPQAHEPGYRPLPPAPRGRRRAKPSATAVVIGAGLAGASAAQALARQGLQVTVLEQDPLPAQRASGNLAGLFHSVIHAQDGAHALLLRAAALYAASHYRGLMNVGARGEVQGLLRGLLEDKASPPQTAPSSDVTILQTLLKRLGLPPEHVQAVDALAASALAGTALSISAWHCLQAGWMNPPSVVQAWLATPGVRLQTQSTVLALRRGAVEGAWQAVDAQGAVLAEAPVMVVASAQDSARLLAPWSDAATWPLENTRGQVTHIPPAHSTEWQTPRPRMPVASGAYALSLPADLGGGLLCGATKQWDDPDPTVRVEDHHHNLSQLPSLLGWSAPQEADTAGLGGRVGWRLATTDRLPVVGAVASLALAGLRQLEQPRHVPRVQGLYACTALGARGLTVAPLMGEVLAAWVTGSPMPVPSRVLDAIDPARFIARAQRQGV